MSLKTLRSNWGVAAAFLVVILSLVDMPSVAAQAGEIGCNCIPQTIEFVLDTNVELSSDPVVGIDDVSFEVEGPSNCEGLNEATVFIELYDSSGNQVGTDTLSAQENNEYILSVYEILSEPYPVVKELHMTVNFEPTSCSGNVAESTIQFTSECGQVVSFYPPPPESGFDYHGVGVIKFTESGAAIEALCYPPEEPAPVDSPTPMEPSPVEPSPVEPSPVDPPSKAGKKGTKSPGKGKGGSKNPKTSKSPGKGKGGSKNPKTSKSPGKAGSKTPKNSKSPVEAGSKTPKSSKN